MSSSSPSPLVAAVTQIVDEQAAAWTRGDAEAWSAPFSTDASFVNILGMTLTGRAQIAERHDVMFRTVFRGSASRVLLEGVTSVNEHVAIVRTEHLVSGQRQQPPGIASTDADGTLRTRMLYVVARNSAQDPWMIVAAQNTAIAPAAHAPGSSSPHTP